jgi:hypothetical protein
MPMSELLAKWRRRLRVGRDTSRETTESAVGDDPQHATGRYYGGVDSDQSEQRLGGDAAESTTGPAKNGPFVGRVAGQDSGYTEQTGAEQRAEGAEGSQ